MVESLVVEAGIFKGLGNHLIFSPIWSFHFCIRDHHSSSMHNHSTLIWDFSKLLNQCGNIFNTFLLSKTSSSCHFIWILYANDSTIIFQLAIYARTRLNAVNQFNGNLWEKNCVQLRSEFSSIWTLEHLFSWASPCEWEF